MMSCTADLFHCFVAGDLFHCCGLFHCCVAQLVSYSIDSLGIVSVWARSPHVCGPLVLTVRNPQDTKFSNRTHLYYISAPTTLSIPLENTSNACISKDPFCIIESPVNIHFVFADYTFKYSTI